MFRLQFHLTSLNSLPNINGSFLKIILINLADFHISILSILLGVVTQSDFLRVHFWILVESHQILQNSRRKTARMANALWMTFTTILRHRRRKLPAKGGSSSLGIRIERRNERFPTDLQLFKSGCYKKMQNKQVHTSTFFGQMK